MFDASKVIGTKGDELVHLAGIFAALSLAFAPVASWATQQDEPAPPPAAQAAPAPAPKPAAPVDDGYRTEGLIPGILIGPKVGATLLFPPNVMVGAELRIIGYIGASFEYGVFPRSQSIDAYTLQIKTWSAGLRAYPFRGAFFVGAVLGSYDLTGTQTVFNGTQSQLVTLNISGTYLGPQIGWKWTWDFGLFLGLNLGYGFSLNYQSSLVPPGITSASSPLPDVKKNADQYLKPGVPILTLLEIGFLF